MFSHFKYRFKRSSSTNGMSNQSCCELLFVVCALNCLPDTLLLPLPFKIALKTPDTQKQSLVKLFSKFSQCAIYFSIAILFVFIRWRSVSRHYRREMYFIFLLILSEDVEDLERGPRRVELKLLNRVLDIAKSRFVSSTFRVMAWLFWDLENPLAI